MSVKTTFFGLHMNYYSLVWISAAAVMVGIAAICWLVNVNRSSFIGVGCLVIISLVAADMCILTKDAIGPQVGESYIQGFLSAIPVFAFFVSIVVIRCTYADPPGHWGGGGPGEDSPEGDGGPPPEGIDWDSFDLARAQWSQSRDLVLTS